MCKYCEGDNYGRENLLYTRNNEPICIWDNKLMVDDGENDEVVINYCPMCGRKLYD